MGGNTYSTKITRREEREAKYTTTKPKFEGVLTREMVNFELTENVNNYGSNKYASREEVAKVVAEKLRQHYNNKGFEASGGTVRLGSQSVTITGGGKSAWGASPVHNNKKR